LRELERGGVFGAYRACGKLNIETEEVFTLMRLFVEKAKKFVFGIFLLLILIFCVFVPQALGAEPVGRADSVQAGFWAVRNSYRVDLGDGGEIFEYDILETDQTGYARVIFADQSVLEIASNSNIDVRSVVFSPDRNRFNVGVMQGAARVITGEIVKRNPRNFKITTPKSTIGIRGTTLLVEVRTTYEKFTVEAIGEGHAVNYSSRSSRDSWTMTKPGDTISVSVSAPEIPVAPTSPVSPASPPAQVVPTISPAVSVSVEAQGEGVVQGERDLRGTDKSGGGDNPREERQGTPGSSGGGRDNDAAVDHDSSGGNSGGSSGGGDDCCNDNSSPGVR
jgi:hypothetical protein